MLSKKDISKILEEYVCDPDVYEYAYKNCAEYKVFIDTLSEKNKKNFDRARAMLKVAQGSEKVREGLLHASTFGLTLGIKKLVNRKTKEERIAELVASCEFIEIFRFFNETKLFCDDNKKGVEVKDNGSI